MLPKIKTKMVMVMGQMMMMNHQYSLQSVYVWQQPNSDERRANRQRTEWCRETDAQSLCVCVSVSVHWTRPETEVNAR